ncbi:MAG: hypothetical protein JNL97_17055 [Verrucomicrobiales bacterium]|nr:hypothetical protein [Verrucomicrobiales bacterium]
MKKQHLTLAAAAAFAAGGLWFAASAWRDQASSPSNARSAGDFLRRSATDDPALPSSDGRARLETPAEPSRPDPVPRPPDPTRRFTEFTPEQRVEFARRGSGPGG